MRLHLIRGKPVLLPQVAPEHTVHKAVASLCSRLGQLDRLVHGRVVRHAAELIDGIRRMNDYSCIERVDLLPFHKMGEYKYEELHFPYELTDTKEPTDEVIEWAENALKEVRQSHH